MSEQELFDSHTHVESKPLYVYRRGELRGVNCDDLIAWMNKYGIKYAAVSSIDPMIHWNWSKWRLGGNELVLEGIKKYGERIVGLFVPNAYLSSEELKRQVADSLSMGFKGIKLHPWLSGFPANDPMLYPILEVASRHKLPILYHSGTPPYSTPLLIAEIAKEFPRVPVIMGHSGKHDLYLDALAAAKLSDNIYLETSGQTIKQFYEKAIELIGAERILFGTDGPSWGGTVYYYVTLISELSIPKRDKEKILFENAYNLFIKK